MTKTDGACVERHECNARTSIVRFKLDTPLSFVPGQFVMLTAEGVNDQHGKPIRRAYSIASSNKEGMLEFCVEETSPHGMSHYLCNAKPGDNLHVEGPFGRFVEGDDSRNRILIGSGTGIAPLLSMIRSTDFEEIDYNIFLWFSVKTNEELLYLEELLHLARTQPKFYLFLHVTREMPQDVEATQGRIKIDQIQNVVKDLNALVFICGSPEMALALKRDFVRAGATPKDVRIEVW